MANSKISALTAATTPLAGTEVLPIVQSGSTVKVSAANVTAGRAVSMLSNTIGTSPGAVTAPTNADDLVVQNNAAAGITILSPDANAGRIHFGTVSNNTNVTLYGQYNYGFDVYLEGTKVIHFDTPTKDTTWSVGNLIQGTAAKGINFTANTGAAGMTSQLLNWYEEGTWTPAQGAGLTLVGAFSSAGKYTRIGRQVTINASVSGATSVALAAGGILTNNLPFSVGTIGHGNATNAAITAASVLVCSTTNVTGVSAIVATTTINFSATYIV